VLALVDVRTQRWDHWEIVIEMLCSNCELMLTGVSRYSNTLLLSLNNRIYFRDHPFRGAHGDTRCYVDSGRSFRSSVTPLPLTFAQNGLRRHATSINDNLKLDTMSGTPTLDLEKSSVVGASQDPRCVLPSLNFGQTVQYLRIAAIQDGDSVVIPMYLKRLPLRNCCFLRVHRKNTRLFCL
jgi:hypothetical protein